MATPSANWDWYTGPTLLQLLETLPVTDEAHDGHLLVPVQYVARDDGQGTGHQHRVMWGRIAHGGVKAGDRVGIIGLGGLGQIGARVAHLLGAEVHVAEIKEDIWPLAKELGAVDARRSITDYPRGFFDVIVDFAGFGDTTADAVDVIRLGGVVVLVGGGDRAAVDSAALRDAAAQFARAIESQADLGMPHGAWRRCHPPRLLSLQL